MNESKTAFVTLCDGKYFHRAKQTIKDLRTYGNWNGPIVLIEVDYTTPLEFISLFQVQCVSFPRIDVASYVNKLREKPFSHPTDDGREYTKTTQWEKLHVFEPYFKQYERIVWVDAGLRILDDVDNLLALDWRGKFVAPDDTVGKSHRFQVAVETENRIDELAAATHTYNLDLNDAYFLNCIWIHDTSIPVEMSDFLEGLHYPIWRHNEMGVMNAVLHFKRKLWSPFPTKAVNGKFLFDWCELNRGSSAHWTEYCALKYPVTIRFDV